MELKLIITFKNETIETSSNRTFMELKYRRYCTLQSPYLCSNRTFMELKCGNGQVTYTPVVF